MFYKIINDDIVVVKGFVIYNKDKYKENDEAKLYFSQDTIYNDFTVQDGFLLSAHDINDLCLVGLAQKCENTDVTSLSNDKSQSKKTKEDKGSIKDNAL